MSELTYPGPQGPNSGWSGSETSRDRALSEDAAGITGANQRAAYAVLARSGRSGATWREVAALHDWDHGRASGALSNLHRADRIARLTEVRSRCKVYVLPEFVDGRPTEGPGKQSNIAGPERQVIDAAVWLVQSQPSLVKHTHFSIMNGVEDPQKCPGCALVAAVRLLPTTVYGGSLLPCEEGAGE